VRQADPQQHVFAFAPDAQGPARPPAAPREAVADELDAAITPNPAIAAQFARDPDKQDGNF
jgi:hypothetical protein